MKHLLLSLVITVVYLSSAAQDTISYFNWNNNSVTDAVIGTNALTGSNGMIYSDGLGYDGPTGGSSGIDLVIPIPSINSSINTCLLEFSIDFRRRENTGSIMKSVTPDFEIEMNGGDLDIRFTTNSTTRDINDIYAIPNDNVFRNFKFIFDDFLDQVRLEVDGSTVWSTNIAVNEDLIMPSSLTIGERMDASGNSQSIFDNFLVSYTACLDLTLPIELISFSAIPLEKEVQLNWSTASETNNDYFTIERSTNGIDFEEIENLAGAGNSSVILDYSAIDKNPILGTSYYRLKQTDFNGDFSYSDIVSVQFEGTKPNNIRLFPNPNNGQLLNISLNSARDESIQLKVYSIFGTDVFSKELEVNKGLNLGKVVFNKTLTPGAYVVVGVNKQGLILFNEKLLVK
jgi:hypothetical protein